MQGRVVCLLCLLLAACTGCPELREGSSNAPALIFLNDGLPDEQFNVLINRSIDAIESVPALASAGFPMHVATVDESVCQAMGKDHPYPWLQCTPEGIAPAVRHCSSDLHLIVFTEEYILPHANVVMGKNGGMYLMGRGFSRNAFLHEFGHLLGLRDEYVQGVQAGGVAGTPGPNCLPEDLAREKWSDILPGCAGHDEYYRPAGGLLMNVDKGEEGSYGPQQEEYLQQVTDCCFRENRTSYSCDAFFEEFPSWSACKE